MIKNIKDKITPIKIIIFIISFSFIYQLISNDIALSIEYLCEEDTGRIQVFYDNKKEYPFDQAHSTMKPIESASDAYKEAKFFLGIDECKKIRIDFDYIEGIRVKKIKLSIFGFKFKEFNNEELMNIINGTNDLELRLEGNDLVVENIKDDGYFLNENTNVNTVKVKVIILIISIIISIFITLLVSNVLRILNIKIEIKNKNEVALIIAFCILIMGPNILYKFISEKDKLNIENRTLKDRPTLNIDNWDSYPGEYEEYYEDNLPFKDYLVKLNSIIKYRIFDISPAKYVIKGENDWLYYNSKYKNDGDTLADYQGTNLYNEEELEGIKNNLLEKQAFLKRKGIELYIMVVPNKSQIYYENMPNEYIKNEGHSRADQAVSYLNENTDLNIVYPKDKLLELKDQYQLYSKIDSHWTDLGAYIGYCQLMELIDDNFESKPLSELGIEEKGIDTGDLASMINLNEELQDKSYKISGVNDNVKVKLIEDKGYEMNRYESTNKNNKKVLVYRDSFFVQLSSFIAKEFEETALVWGEPFSEEQVKEEKPDVVIIEVAERLLDNLIK